jgi:hypothetical protein
LGKDSTTEARSMAQPRGRSQLHARTTNHGMSTPARNTRTPSRSPMTHRRTLKTSQSPGRNTKTTPSPMKSQSLKARSRSPRKPLGIATPSHQRRGMVEVEEDEATSFVQETPIKPAVTEDENSSGKCKESLSVAFAPNKDQSPVAQELEAFEIKVKEEGGLIEDDTITIGTAAGGSTNEVNLEGTRMTSLHPEGKENVSIPAHAPFSYHHGLPSFHPMYSAPHSLSFDASAFAGPSIAFQQRWHSQSSARGSGPPLPHASQYYPRYYPPPHAYYPSQYGCGFPNTDDSNPSHKRHLENSSPLTNKGNPTKNKNKGSGDKKTNRSAPPAVHPASSGDMMSSGPSPRGPSPFPAYPPSHQYSYHPPSYFGCGSASPYYPPYGGSTLPTQRAHEPVPDTLDATTPQAAGEGKDAHQITNTVGKNDDTSSDETTVIGMRSTSDGDEEESTPPMPLLHGE